jgi:hypothetical protein
MRPARKARGGRIPGVCNRRATPRPGMQRRPNVTGFRGRDTSTQDPVKLRYHQVDCEGYKAVPFVDPCVRHTCC